MHRISLKQAKGGWRICLSSARNGKLIMQGEVVKEKRNAQKTLRGIQQAYDSWQDSLEQGPDLPLSHRWPTNAKKK